MMTPSPEHTVARFAGTLIADARHTITSVGYNSDSFAQGERSIAYGLLLQAREWLASPPIEQATLYDGGPLTGLDMSQLHEQIGQFARQDSHEQYHQIVALGSLLQAAYEDLTRGEGINRLDRAIAKSYFTNMSISTSFNTLIAPLLVCLGLLASATFARAQEDFANTSEQIIEQWTRDMLPRITTRTRVAIGPITWPREYLGLPGPHRTGTALRGALIARLTACGMTVVSEHETWDTIVFGGAWDHGEASRAILIQARQNGRLTIASRVNVVMPVWNPAVPYDHWSVPIEAFALRVAEGLWLNKVRRLTLSPQASNVDGQATFQATESIHRVLIPPLVQALTDRGIEVYLPADGSPVVRLEIGAEWPTVNLASETNPQETVDGATVYAWAIHQHGKKQYVAGPLSAALAWPGSVRSVSKLEQLSTRTLEFPFLWTIDGQHLLAEDREWREQSAKWAADNLASHRRRTDRMLKESLARLTTQHRTATQGLHDAWQQSPSQSVPHEIQEQSEKLQRHLVPLRRELEKRLIQGEPRVHPYPQG